LLVLKKILKEKRGFLFFQGFKYESISTSKITDKVGASGVLYQCKINKKLLLEPQFKKKIGRGSKPNQAGLRALV
jgi:hypothetical protein